jgi:hypothetical protein
MEDTPETHPDRFESVRGRRARRHCDTGEVWQKDLLRDDHWEVYKGLREFEHGLRHRAVWSDGCLKEEF